MLQKPLACCFVVLTLVSLKRMCCVALSLGFFCCINVLFFTPPPPFVVVFFLSFFSFSPPPPAPFTCPIVPLCFRDGVR